MAKIKKPDSIGSFLGLITSEGKLRMQMRTEKSSPITGVSYKGDFELTGGGVKEKDLKVVLTPEGLLQEGIREAKEELGIKVTMPETFPVYWAPYENPKTGKVDWAFMIPIGSEYWDENTKMKRKTVDVDPNQLDVLGELNLVISGKKRMYQMGQWAIYAQSPIWSLRAAELLIEVKPDWLETEYHSDTEGFLKKLLVAIS